MIAMPPPMETSSLEGVLSSQPSPQTGANDPKLPKLRASIHQTGSSGGSGQAGAQRNGTPWNLKPYKLVLLCRRTGTVDLSEFLHLIELRSSTIAGGQMLAGGACRIFSARPTTIARQRGSFSSVPPPCGLNP